MKRVLLKQYDECNRVWLVHYCRVYSDSVNVQTFRGDSGYVGFKRRTGPGPMDRQILPGRALHGY